MPPLSKDDAAKLIARRAHEWHEHQRRWRFLQDSLEGGNRYRHADYVHDPLATDAAQSWYRQESSGQGWAGDNRDAIDPVTGTVQTKFYGVVTDANLIPHVSETTPGGAAVYAMRLSRTPVPMVVARAVRKHLSRIYSNEVQRKAPADVEAWWEDVDGTVPPTTIDKWMRKTVAPLLLVLGQLDLQFDHPALPDGVTADMVRSRADQARYKLAGCVASYILPENMVWWRLDPATRGYAECLVFERADDGVRWRHWTDAESNAYTPKGEWIGYASRPHPFGRVPIVRVFDDRKTRCRNVGQSRYEDVAEYQRSIYNRSSELHLADVLQSHPTLSGPEDFLGPDSKVPVGPGHTLPKKKDATGNYEGWEYVDPPQDAHGACRQHMLDDQDEADRSACLLKPAGMTSSSSVGQSGISKVADQQEGNDYLSEVAETLADAERTIARMAMLVLSDGVKDDDPALSIVYQKQFDLYTLDDLMKFVTDAQGVTAAGGDLPLLEAEALKRSIRIAFPGITDEKIKAIENEIDAFFAAKAADRERMAEMRQLVPMGEGGFPPQGDQPVPGDATAISPQAATQEPA